MGLISCSMLLANMLLDLVSLFSGGHCNPPAPLLVIIHQQLPVGQLMRQQRGRETWQITVSKEQKGEICVRRRKWRRYASVKHLSKLASQSRTALFSTATPFRFDCVK